MSEELVPLYVTIAQAMHATGALRQECCLLEALSSSVAEQIPW
jgi:hypothetical protein